MPRGPKRHQPVVPASAGKGGRGSKSPAPPARSRSPGGTPYILDRQLVPRIMALSKQIALTDVDGMARSLRSAYKEYERRPNAAFRAMVIKALAVAQANQVRGRVV
jgi:hypothetical protein